jgi:hypothetical protein
MTTTESQITNTLNVIIDSLEEGEIIDSLDDEESDEDDIQYSQKCSVCLKWLYDNELVVQHPKKKYHVIHKSCLN